MYDFWFYLVDEYVDPLQPHMCVPLEDSDLEGDEDGAVIDADGVTLHVSISGILPISQVWRIFDRVHARVVRPIAAQAVFRVSE